jgi:Family of unknown function (DUF5336)
MAEFDVKRVTTLEWAGIGAGLLAFIVSFFPWLTVDFGGDLADLAGIDTSVSGNAWDAGFLGWFSVLLLIAAAVIVVLPHFGTEIPQASMIWMILGAVAFLFILLRWLTYESVVDPGWGLFVGLVLAVVSAVSGFLAFRAAPSTTPQAGPAYPAA